MLKNKIEKNNKKILKCSEKKNFKKIKQNLKYIKKKTQNIYIIIYKNH